MSEVIDLLKSAGIEYIFHSTRAIHLGAIADSGILSCSALLGRDTPGSKKDISYGGGNYVYFRYIQDKCGTKFSAFGTRSSLDQNVHFVMPAEKLNDYFWFISSVDMNGKIPKGVSNDQCDMPEQKKISVVKALKRYPNDKNGEIGVHECVQLSDISHIVISRENFETYKRDYLSLLSSINAMKQAIGDSGRVKVIIGSSSEIAFARIANAHSFIQ